MARPPVLKIWIVLALLSPIAGLSCAFDAEAQSSKPEELRKVPPDSKAKTSKLNCASLCQQQQLGMRLEGNDRKLFQQCFAQALCPTELGPPVVHQPPPSRAPPRSAPIAIRAISRWPRVTGSNVFPYPEIFLVQALVRPVCLALAGTILFSGLFSLFSTASDRAASFLSNLVIVFSYSVPVTVLAFVGGYLTGVSRNGVVGSILPAVLSLIGGVAVYVFGTENRYKVVIGYCVLMFPISLLYGAQTGALERQVGREAFIKNLSEQEKRIRNFRYNLELPEEPPGWVVPKDDK